MAYRLIISLAVAAVAVFSLLTLAFPETILPLTAEDRLVETTTALVFLAGFLVALGQPGRFRHWRAVAGCFALIAFLDELSFGERLFGWEAYYIRGVKLDGAHDILQILRRSFVAEFRSPWLVASVCAALAAISVAALIAFSPQVRRGLRRIAGSVTPPTSLLIAAFGFVALSQVLDLKLGPLRLPVVKASQVEEYLELMSGVLTLSFILATQGRRSGVAHDVGTVRRGPTDEEPGRVPVADT